MFICTYHRFTEGHTLTQTGASHNSHTHDAGNFKHKAITPQVCLYYLLEQLRTVTSQTTASHVSQTAGTGTVTYTGYAALSVLQNSTF